MKKIAYILVLIFLGSGLLAQESTTNEEIKTLFGNNVSHGGFLGFTMGYAQIDSKDAFTVGGQMAWIINHSLALGFAGNGFVNNISEDYDGIDPVRRLNGGYGGFLIQPIIGGRQPIHLSFPIILGAGGVALTNEEYDTYNEWENRVLDSDAFLIIEPGVNIEFNVMKHFRIACGVSYRYTSDVHMFYINNQAICGFAANISMQIGKF